MATWAVRDSIREVDENTWIVGDKLLLSRKPTPPPLGIYWSDGRGSCYILSNAPQLPPGSQSLSSASPFKKVYDAGDASAVWMMGEAFCKVRKFDPEIPRATREHVTLEHLHRRSLSFDIPQVLHYTESHDRFYIFLTKVPGETLMEAWPRMDEGTKQRAASRVTSICKELAVWRADSICGVDGEYLSEMFLVPSKAKNDCSPANLLKNSLELGMDCSTFMFYHCDLGPGNIMVGPSGDVTGIIDWGTAGFVPVEWIRTTICFSSGMDLDVGDVDQRTDWRKRLQQELGREGFPEIVDRWMKWWKGSYPENGD